MKENPDALLYYRRGSFPRCIPNGLSTQYWSGYHAANPLQNYLSLARCRSTACPALALPLGGRCMSSRDPPGRLSSHDLGPSRDGVWEVFSSGLASSMCKKKEANEPYSFHLIKEQAMMWFLPLYGPIDCCGAVEAVRLGVVLSNCVVL